MRRHVEFPVDLVTDLEGEGTMPAFRIFDVLASGGGGVVHVGSGLLFD